MVICVLSFVLIMLDSRFHFLNSARVSLMNLATPFYWVADVPERLVRWGSSSTMSRSELKADNERLNSEALVLKAKLQKLASLAAENIRLRELLNSSAILQDNVLAAEIIGISPDPAKLYVMVNKGKLDNVFVGQPVIDAYGLVGQVIEVGSDSCRVLLIADDRHALPVQVNRSGVRAVAEGKGLLHELQLTHVPATTDIKVDDTLVSSGLGGRFPVGYPVGTVTSIVQDPGQPFLSVNITPSAQLNRSRHVLLVFTTQNAVAAPQEPADEN